MGKKPPMFCDISIKEIVFHLMIKISRNIRQAEKNSAALITSLFSKLNTMSSKSETSILQFIRCMSIPLFQFFARLLVRAQNHFLPFLDDDNIELERERFDIFCGMEFNPSCAIIQ